MNAGSRLLVLAFDPLTEAMPGPAIRAWHLAAELATEHEVVLATTSECTRASPAMQVRAVAPDEIAGLVDRAEVIVAPTSVVRRHPAVAGCEKPLCIDMYIPTHLENLEPFGDFGGPTHVEAVAHQVAVVNDDLRRGDFFLCASERQRDFWLGSLASLGRVNPSTYGDDAGLRRLIDVVPFGIPAEPPVALGPTLRDTFPGIASTDPVLIWAGGVYNWFDPLTLVRAVDRVREGIPEVRLVFLGMRNPNSEIPEMRMAAELRRLSEELRLTGTHVFFNEGWVPYESRGRYLLDADIGVSTHLGHVETHFSFRTRVLDYLWAGLPMALTAGDALSGEIEANNLGVAVPPGDVDALAGAIEQLIREPLDREAVRDYGLRYRWDSVVGPLLAYCGAPWRAPDRVLAPAPLDQPADPPLVGGAAQPPSDLQATVRRLARRVSKSVRRP